MAVVSAVDLAGRSKDRRKKPERSNWKGIIAGRKVVNVRVILTPRKT